MSYWVFWSANHITQHSFCSEMKRMFFFYLIWAYCDVRVWNTDQSLKKKNKQDNTRHTYWSEIGCVCVYVCVCLCLCVHTFCPR